MLAASLSWAVYTIVMKPALATGDSLGITAASTLAGAACTLPFVRSSTVDTIVHLTLHQLLILLWLALAVTVVGYLAWNEGVRGLDPSRASVYLYPITPLSLLAAVVLLDEPWSPALGISCVLVLGGVALAQRGCAGSRRSRSSRVGAWRRPTGIRAPSARVQFSASGALRARLARDSGLGSGEEERVEAAHEAGDRLDALGGEQRAVHEDGAVAVGVVPHHEPLAGQAEVHLDGRPVARQADRVHAGAAELGATRLERADQLVVASSMCGLAHAAEQLGQLARGAARHVGLRRLVVLHDLPVRDVGGREASPGAAAAPR